MVGKTSQKKNNISAREIIWNLNFSVHKWVLSEHCHGHSFYVLSLGAFMLQKQSWAVGAKTTWSIKLETFTSWFFPEKVCQSSV